MDRQGGLGRSRGRARASQPVLAGDTGRGTRTTPMPAGLGGDAPTPVVGGAWPRPSAWGQPSCTPQPQARTMVGQATGLREITAAATISGAPTPTQESLAEAGRGGVRGKRLITTELVRTRPAECTTKIGTTGKRITVQANYFRVLRRPEWSIHQYRVDFAPDIDAIRLRRAYMAHHKAFLGGYIFDGTMLFCTRHFSDKMVNGSIELLTKNREGETIQVKLKHVGIVEVTDVQQMQVLNLILRRAMEGLNLQLVGRNFFDPQAKVGLENYKMEIWPGYQTSIRQHERDVLLCSEIAHKVMRTDDIYGIMSQLARDTARGGNFQDTFKKEIIGSVVLTDYNNKTYRVDDVDFNSTPLKTFKKRDGSEMTLAAYYKERYNITIRDLKQPLLVSRPTERNMRAGEDQFILLIPEISRATGLTDVMRSNFRLMKALGEHTRLPPERRIERLMRFNERLQKAPASVAVLQDWNLQLDRSLVELPARLLPQEKIFFGKEQFYCCDNTADWNREFRQKAMYRQVNINRWCVVVPRYNVREIKNFVKMCCQAARGMGMQFSEPLYEEMPDDRNGSYLQAIDCAAQQDPQIIMPVLVNNNAEKYSCIKKKCCVDRALPSQVVTLRTVAPRGDKAAGLMSVATKVVIQMNAKLMGQPWLVSIPLDGLMAVGFDVCHSAKERNKSYGALVATMDVKTSTRFYSSVSAHEKGQELSNEIAMKMAFAIKAYRKEHSKLPDRIVFYRDGVGEGQLHQVYNTEVEVLKKRLNEIYKAAGVEAGCRLAFIVVSKRINTRFFTNKRNPVPGTVVDDFITLPERYDFFLVSQSTRVGTVSPTSYNVLYDTMGLPADRMQMLTYKMTHMYYNWSGTCRVPAVCQYAHKLAFLVAESIHRAPNNALENQLYFL